MKTHLQFIWILLALMTTVCANQAKVVQTLYEKVVPGQKITGNIAAELTTRSRIQCSDRLVNYKI